MNSTRYTEHNTEINIEYPQYEENGESRLAHYTKPIINTTRITDNNNICVVHGKSDSENIFNIVSDV